jgi:hypothetical protein
MVGSGVSLAVDEWIQGLAAVHAILLTLIGMAASILFDPFPGRNCLVEECETSQFFRMIPILIAAILIFLEIHIILEYPRKSPGSVSK